MTPPALDRVVKKCLAKEPDKRWQAASDVCGELKWIAEGVSGVGLAGAPVEPRKSRERVAWGISSNRIGAVIGLIACQFALMSLPRDAAARDSH